MATRKTTDGQVSDPAEGKPTVEEATSQRASRQIAAARAVDRAPSRLLREAAWSQMFGRVESKNPFAR